MCVVIFSGKRKNLLYKTGMDVFAEKIGDVTDDNYFYKNTGKEKRYPGGPTCSFQGKEVPCLTRWSPKGSITSDILIDILSTLDHLKLFDCSNGKLVFIFLGGRGSRFVLNVLAYVTNKAHEWCVCVGVPYGKLMW